MTEQVDVILAIMIPGELHPEDINDVEVLWKLLYSQFNYCGIYFDFIPPLYRVFHKYVQKMSKANYSANFKASLSKFESAKDSNFEFFVLSYETPCIMFQFGKEFKKSKGEIPLIKRRKCMGEIITEHLVHVPFSDYGNRNPTPCTRSFFSDCSEVHAGRVGAEWNYHGGHGPGTRGDSRPNRSASPAGQRSCTLEEEEEEATDHGWIGTRLTVFIF